ncbi:MAG TPA: TIGR03621 family F420-dependent LLM class oxidoreductase [Thermomicrobiales bacterium]|nr:TIGR03621 family F420-dependent LLM class oxidoreductase [Thermomicrobiales bacterium]
MQSLGFRPFRFGVINERFGSPREWTERARRAEALGYATFLIRDHLVADYFGDQFAPLPALMAAALATTTLRVGTLVLDNDFRHPALLAKEAATLDFLSGGRLELGLGAGWLKREYDAAGIPYDPAGVRIDRLEESIAVLQGSFADGPFTFTGRHYQVDGLDSFPKPAQRPGPPLLIGAGRRRMLTLAGREADIVGFLSVAVGSGVVADDPAERLPAAVAEKIDWAREGAGDRWSEIELSMMVPTPIATDDRRAATDALIRERGWTGIAPEQVWEMPSVLIGSTDQIVEDLLRRREEFGFSYYVVADDAMEAFAPIVAELAGS